MINICEGKNDFTKEIINAQKPLFILGESFFKLESADYLFNLIKDLLNKNNKINNEWNSLNKLTNDASTVGSLDLKIINENGNIFDDLKSNKFEIIYLLGQDNLNFDKKDEFIIYQGSHGDKGAEIADIILPGAAYTEQNGYFTNLEGKVQKAFKASYPPGDAKEDWQIINDLAEFMNNRKLFNDKDELESSMFNFINLQKDNKTSVNQRKISSKSPSNENLIVSYKDYYFSNVVARSSKTMLDCYNSKLETQKTGTDG